VLAAASKSQPKARPIQGVFNGHAPTLGAFIEEERRGQGVEDGGLDGVPESLSEARRERCLDVVA
jgi:hypothetical protein